MTDKLSIYNGALSILGERRLASLTENREPRYKLDDVWDNNFVRRLLQMGQWQFAQRTVQLPGVVVAVADVDAALAQEASDLDGSVAVDREGDGGASLRGARRVSDAVDVRARDGVDALEQRSERVELTRREEVAERVIAPAVKPARRHISEGRHPVKR